MLRDPAIVISGGTGFLGRYLVDAFLGAGYRVGVLCRASSPREVLDGQEVTFFEADIESATACRLALASARESLGDFQMVHNAALVSYRECDREALRRTNVDGVRNVWAACAEVGVRRGVHVSSVVAVGTSPAGQRIDEEHPFDGHALGVEYVDTKWAGEQIALGDHGSMEVVVVNPGAIFGPVEATSNTARFLIGMAQGRIGRLAPPGGMAAVGVWDCAEGVRLALERGKTGRRYILAESNPSSRELFALVGELLEGRDPVWCTVPGPLWSLLCLAVGLTARVREPAMTTPQAMRMLGVRFCQDAARARTELGWNPKPLRGVLSDTIRILRERGILPR